MLRRRLFIPFCLVFTLAGTHLSHAQELRELRAFEHHVRTNDLDLRALVRQGIDGSPSFRALVDHLTRSDVLVYLEQTYFPNPRLEGTLTFMAKAGDVRYLKIQVAWGRSPHRQLAAIAHELQHATEVAEAPGVIDARTLAEEYGRIGYERHTHQGRRFESTAAIEAGDRVWREYLGD